MFFLMISVSYVCMHVIASKKNLTRASIAPRDISSVDKLGSSVRSLCEMGTNLEGARKKKNKRARQKRSRQPAAPKTKVRRKVRVNVHGQRVWVNREDASEFKAALCTLRKKKKSWDCMEWRALVQKELQKKWSGLTWGGRRVAEASQAADTKTRQPAAPVFRTRKSHKGDHRQSRALEDSKSAAVAPSSTPGQSAVPSPARLQQPAALADDSEHSWPVYYRWWSRKVFVVCTLIGAAITCGAVAQWYPDLMGRTRLI